MSTDPLYWKEAARAAKAKPQVVAWRVRENTDSPWHYIETWSIVKNFLAANYEVEQLLDGGPVGVGAVLTES